MKKRITAVILFFTLMIVGCGVNSRDTLAGDTGVKTRTVSQKDKKENSQDGTELEIHYIDVGQGDCTLIKFGEHAMLIDAGDNSKGTAVQAYLNSQNIRRLDYVIGTHPDADHIGGLDVVIYKFDVEKVFMPDVTADTRTYEDVEQAVKEKNLKIKHPKAGKSYSLGNASFTVVSPVKDYGDDTNDWSIGLVVQYGKSRFLFTGDAEEKAEEDIISSGADVSADVYKAAHHGSRTGSSEEFLDAVRPEYAVISCGEGNKYGHPSAQTLINFRSRGIETFRTDDQGTVVAVSDGKKITWNMSPDDNWAPGEPEGTSDSEQKKSGLLDRLFSFGQNAGKEKSSTKYVLNTATGKFHRPTCRYVEKISEKNREDTSKSREELIGDGYDACKICNP